MMLNKTCKCCGKKKSASEFLETGNKKGKGDGLHNWCFDCMSAKTLTCPTCGEAKTVEHFGKSVSHSTGYFPHCTDCVKKANRTGTVLKKFKPLGAPVPRSVPPSVIAPEAKEEHPIVKAFNDAGAISGLKRVSDEDIFAELRRRGYQGELTPPAPKKITI